MSADRPWDSTMPDKQFQFMRDLLGAPSPIGLEAAMTEGVMAPYLDKFMPDSWKIHRFRGNASIVVDTAPDAADAFSVMMIGHADKIRLQVRSVGDDGKIWVNCDSFLPITLISQEVVLYSENPKKPGEYRTFDGGTIEAIGAIHFADAETRSGRKGIKPEMLYLELGLHGKKRKEQVEKLGIRAGDPLLLKRKIRRGFAQDSFYGAYLDNGLGCFVVAEVARLIAERGGLKNVRFLGAAATHEEIGRMGSRVLAGEMTPDVVVGLDVSHDLAAAPRVGDRRFTPNAMGKGMTLAVGSITSSYVNSMIQQVAKKNDIPCQLKVVGRDTGTDAMAGVFSGRDSAAVSVGFPIRNMHTASECGHTGDVLAAVYAMTELLFHMDSMNGGAGIAADDLRSGHPRLDQAKITESAK
ncbi:MAG: peptidase M42 [Planctomycetota bacterium]